MTKCANCSVTLDELVYRVKGEWWCQSCYRHKYP